MVETWIPLNSLPSGGLSLTVDDPAVWDDPVREFKLGCLVRQPLKADVFLLSQEDGCFVRGHLTGEVSLPCDRCAEDAIVELDVHFETFEPIPGAAAEDEEEDAELDESVMRMGESGPEINVAVLLWEEFSLALPIHPLCRAQCAGLCPSCGKNLNEGPCNCAKDEGDPRLATLRGLTLNK